MQNQSRKKRNVEIERQKKRQRRSLMGIMFAIGLVIILAIAWVAWDAQSRRWILTFDGERIATGDMRFFMDTFTLFGMEDEAKEMAREELLNALTLMNRAEMHGVGLTAEERTQLEEEFADQVQWMGANYISVARVAELFGVGPLQQRLMEIYVPEDDFTPDPVEFAAGLIEYIDNNAHGYSTYDVQYIVFNDPTEAATVFGMVNDYDFEELIREHSIYYSEEWGITTMDVRQMIEDFWVGDEDAEILMGLQEGQSHMVQLDEYFVIVQMHDRSEADVTIMEENFRTNFATSRRAEIFSDYIQSWRDATEYTFNDRALDSL